MSDHASTLDRLEAFDDLGKSPSTAWLAVLCYLCGAYGVAVGEPALFAIMFVEGSLVAAMFDYELRDAHDWHERIR